jgi:hypothetical protein
MAETTLTCQQCSATIYPEHIAKRRAGKIGGKLLCPVCVNERIEKMSASGPAVTASGVVSNSGLIDAGPSTVTAAPPAPVEEDEPIELVEDANAAPRDESQIRVFNKSSLAVGSHEREYKRDLVNASLGATRCRIFHAKMTDGALVFMENQINEWIDEHPDIHVKFSTSTMGTIESKQSRDQHVIVTVFY